MIEFRIHDISSDELERRRAIYEPLARSVRALIDATIRTEVEAEAVAAVTAEIDAATARLRSRQMDGPYGVRYNADGQGTASGNAVIGLRNPVAPPLVVEHDESGKVWADFVLGAAYEGPPGHAHGGVCALILDHVLGEAASGGLTKPSFTGTISCRYLRATPLGPLHAEAWVDGAEGVKTYAVGHLADAEGVTVEAEGVFVVPKWAR
ncbi:PaaI family thioesterase [Mycobacterium sp.]|uniref:PaaI family thioesterase n=1 Tax=Mycobacterium sp. TaxID=1785 RepID=UPI002BFA2699|nr:PaaI family thioesterase [Mycobacterium sp.]HME48876.1 PaaI family thioesterase [Mycobacterium sp.]